MTEPAREEEVQELEAVFSAGRPYESLARLGQLLGRGMQSEVLGDAIVILHRIRGAGAATGALALAEAAGARTAALEAHREAIEAQRTRRLMPEVLARILTGALANPQPGHYDVERWPDGKPSASPDALAGTIRYMAEHAEELEWAADRLDAESREVLIQRLVYITLEHERARIGPSVQELARLTELTRERLQTSERVRGLGFLDAADRRNFVFSHRFDLRPVGVPVTIETSMFGLVATYLLQQYWAPHQPEARPREGDVVVDGGGYLGETALWFAHLVGETGRVMTFEMERGALAILRENLAANPDLASRIAINEDALWDEPGHRLPIVLSGPGTALMAEPAGDDESQQPGERIVSTTSIDALVQTGALPRLDFLKLDIEGAESAALRGAERTLRRFRPRLALAAYHRFDDMWALMRQIDELDLGYRFAMAHFTPHHEETVLYAWVPEER